MTSPHRLDEFHTNWRNNATDCAVALRAYANKYHKPDHIPDSVRRIFTEAEAA